MSQAESEQSDEGQARGPRAGGTGHWEAKAERVGVLGTARQWRTADS